MLSAKINTAIPPSSFELIRDQIGGILLTEFTAQNVSFALPKNCTPTKVEIERFVPIMESEFPIVTVRTASGKYLDENGSQTKDSGGSRVGTNLYYVDAYTGSPTIGTDRGDMIASKTLQRIIGIVMSILEDTRYFTLGFDNRTGPVKIWNTHVRDFFINPPQLKEDNAVDYICARVVFSVDATESVPTIPARELLEINTDVILIGSDSGMVWILKKQVVTVPATADTFSDAFFSNPIVKLQLLDGDNNVTNTYVAGTDFTIDTGTTTITTTDPGTFTFTEGQRFIATT